MAKTARPDRNVSKSLHVDASVALRGDDVAVGRFPALTGLRGLAALAVFLLHAWYLGGKPEPAPDWPLLSDALRWLFQIGWSGVDVFFTLSGFLLSLPFLRAHEGPPATRAFLLRRWLRIFPAYYAQFVVLLVLFAVWSDWSVQVRQAPVGGELLAHGLLWFFAWPAVQPWLAVWWTLPVEFGFYLCLPWLARLLPPGRWYWLLSLIALSWLWRYAWLGTAPLDMVTVHRAEHLPGRIDQFVIGMLGALLWVRNAELRAWAKTHARALLAGSLALFIALPALWLLVDGTASGLASRHPLLLPWHSLASVVVVGMLWAAVSRSSGLLASAPLQSLGTLSYGLYLWHYPVLQTLRWLMREPSQRYPEFWPFVGVALIVSLALAAASYWLVERPCLRRRLG